jgi:integrase
MAMGLTLTAKRILRLRNKPGRYHDGHGLILQVRSPTNASWLLRYQRAGKEHQLGLGPLRLFPLKEARQRARAAQRDLSDGTDPLLAKRDARAKEALAAAKALSFAEAATSYFNQHEKKWRSTKHRDQFLSSMRHYAFPVIGLLPVSTIDTALVLKVIEPIWQTKSETARRLRGRIENVLDWATVRGYRSGDNPARWRGHLAEVLPEPGKIAKAKHHAALPYKDAAQFTSELRQRQGSGARALEFLLLTTARTGEVIGARWDEIDLEAAIWTIPAGRMKGGREHRVPLSPPVIALLKALPREQGSDFVFIGPRPGAGLSAMAMTRTLSRMGRNDITVHGFRSTFMDWAHDTTGYPKVVIDMALTHTVGDKVEAAYRRGDLFAKRTRLMAEWARYCSAPAAIAAAVVQLLQRRRHERL